jgi:hypothetical protein
VCAAGEPLPLTASFLSTLVARIAGEEATGDDICPFLRPVTSAPFLGGRSSSRSRIARRSSHPLVVRLACASLVVRRRACALVPPLGTQIRALVVIINVWCYSIALTSVLASVLQDRLQTNLIAVPASLAWLTVVGNIVSLLPIPGDIWS